MHRTWTLLIPAAVLAPASVTAYAVTYLTVEQAQQLMFPGESLAPSFVELSDEQRSRIEARSGVDVRRAQVKAWRASARRLVHCR